MLNPKPWQLTGEIEGQKRPENSLLEEYLQYDRTTRLRMSKKSNQYLIILFF
jgi:U3 small nucleolar ribonucleoprotein component